jgi:hypothetical protein
MRVTIQKEATRTTRGTGFTEGIQFTNEKKEVSLMSQISLL